MMQIRPGANPTVADLPTAQASPAPARPMGPWAAMILAWVRPATTARRTDHVSLARAFAVHGVILLLFGLLLIVMDTWAVTRRPPWQAGTLEAALDLWMGRMAEECAARPTEFVLSLLGMGVLVVGAAPVLAFLAMPWAAGDEPMVASYRAALRRTWLGTSVLLPAALGFCLLAAILLTARSQWHAADRTRWPTPPRKPGNLLPNTPESDAYRQEIEIYRRSVDRALAEYRRRQPWYVRYDECLLMLAFMAAGTWVLWAWLRFVSADRALPALDHTPLCETCGYNLTWAEMDRRCPECGVPVRDSLGPEARPGPPWERRAEVGSWASGWQSAKGAVLAPRHFGRSLRLHSRTRGFASFLASNLAVLLLCAWAGGLACFVAVTRHQWPRIDFLDAITGTGFLAAVTAAITLGLVCLAAAVVGLGYRLRDRRNLLPVTIQAAAYLAPLLVFWTLCSAATTVVIIQLGSAFEYLATTLGLRQFGFFGGQLLQIAAWLLVNLVFLAAYVHWVARVTAGARYANR